MKAAIEKINRLPLALVLLFLLVFFLPFQVEYTHCLKGLSNWAFAGESLPSYFLKNKLEFFITDLFLLALLFTTRKKLTLSKERFFLLLFLGFTLLSVVCSESQSYGWPYYRFLQLLLPASLAFVPIEEPKRVLHVIFWICFWTALCQCLIATFQYGLQDPLGLATLGEKSLSIEDAATIDLSCGKKWLFGDGSYPKGKLYRAYGTMPHPNILGGFLVLSALGTLYLFLSSKRRYLLGVGLSFQIFGIFLTFSRAAIFGLIFCGALLFFLAWAEKSAKFLAAVAALSFLLSTALLYPPLSDRGGVVNYNGQSERSDAPRRAFQVAAFEMAKERPITGQGWEQSLLKMERYVKIKPQRVHNIYLLLLAEIGVIGTTLFGLYLGAVGLCLFRARSDLMGASLLAIFLFTLLAGLVDHYWLSSQVGRVLFFLYGALMSLYGRSLISHKAKHARSPLPSSTI